MDYYNPLYTNPVKGKVVRIFIIINKVIVSPLLYLLLIAAFVSGSCERTPGKTKTNNSIPLCEEVPQDKAGTCMLHEEAVHLIVAGHYKEAEQRLREIITLQPEFYGAYRTLGEILLKYNNVKTIEDFLHESVKQNHENGYAYWALGLLSAVQKAYDTALLYFKQAILLKPGFYDAYENLVDIYKMQGKLREAAPLLESYFHGLQERDFPHADYGLAYLYFCLGKMDDAFNLCEKLCAGHVKQPAGRLYKLAGTLHSIKRQSLTAAGYYECALHSFRMYGDKQGETAALINLGIANDQLLNYEKALEKYGQALPLAKMLKNHTYEGLLLMNTGLAYQNLDDYSKSFIYYQQALVHFRKMDVPNKEVLIFINNNLGRLHGFLSDYPRALDYYSEALELSREIEHPGEEIKILNNMGDVFKGQMDYEGALNSYTQAMTLIGDNKDFWTKAVILNNIGEIYSQTGDYNQAMNAFRQSLAHRQQTGDRRGAGITNKNIGFLFYLKGDYIQALDYYHKAQTLVDKESAENAEITGEMGICSMALKQYDKAFHHLKKSIEMTEIIRGRLKYEKHKTGFMQNKRRMYNAIVELLYEMAQGDTGKQDEYLAFEYGEKAKARTLLDLLEESRIKIKKGVAPALTTRISEIERKYNSKNTQLQEELKKPAGKENKELVNSLGKELQCLGNEYEDMLIQATIENPRYEQIMYSRPVSPVRIRQNLPDASTLLLAYQLTEKFLFTWYIGKDSFHFSRQILGKKELEEKVLYLHRLLARPANNDDYFEPASQLYALLLKPVLPPGSQYNRLIIIPDGILHYLPFEVLVSSERESRDTPAYLVRQYNIQYVQSATILFHLYSGEKTKPHSESAGKDILLAVGDPAGNTETPGTVITGIDTGNLFFALFSLSDLPSLPYSQREVMEIGNFFPEKLILCGQDAQEERIKQPGALDRYTYIHFATHSIINEESPYMSGLVLTQDNDPGEDGFLQVREIFNLETHADLVILSACKTKLGEYVEGEGIIGLTRAWMYAGASSVIASLWSIHDESASVFMSEFYRNIKAGMSCAAALRQARLFMMEQDRYRHPYFWAAFVLTGKG
ncbi:MAG: CHAT domain-containing protein [Spirochaetales bacterium]|nr:CHAT domain-containing protein [Spirochaetales bacterium]